MQFCGIVLKLLQTEKWMEARCISEANASNLDLLVEMINEPLAGSNGK